MEFRVSFNMFFNSYGNTWKTMTTWNTWFVLEDKQSALVWFFRMIRFINKPNYLLISQTIIIKRKTLNIEMLPAAVGIVFKLTASTAIV